VAEIFSDLSAGIDVSSAGTLRENKGIGFMGLTLSGPFDLDDNEARRMLSAPLNINGRPNSDVVRPYRIGQDVTGRPKPRWVIDFGTDMTLEEAARYQLPFEYVRTFVKPEREKNNRAAYRERWWIHAEARSGMRRALSGLDRYAATVLVSRHHLIVWEDAATAPANRLIVFARQDDYFFGVLQSRAHELWARRLGARHGVGNDPTYNVTSCFETFPLPWPPGQEPWRDPRVHAIVNAANALDAARRAYLDPPDATPEVLKKRTLTTLYNERPAWLAMLHADLDRAVWDAYGWDDPDPATVAEDAILARLLALNRDRTGDR
jgi:hypothetical protein